MNDQELEMRKGETEAKRVMNGEIEVSRSGSAQPSTWRVSIAVIGPDDFLRGSLLSTIRQCRLAEVRDFASYPPKLQDVNNLLDEKHDVVMIELDSDPEYALDLMRAVCADGHSTVMVYSRMPEGEVSESDLLLRCMRMGAREFLNLPFAGEELKQALHRAALRQPGSRVPEKKRGRLLVFCGAKGGAGVTSMACNFAIALSKVSAQKTLLIDMDLPLGDAALHLGMRPRYSTIDALQNFARVDASFLKKLLVHHGSGLAVLPAPGRFPFRPAPNEAYDRLLEVTRQEFENVVVDAGSKFDLQNGCAEYRDATTIYLVTQSGIPELRNANRLIAQYQGMDGPKLEIVLNRFLGKSAPITESEVARALTCPVSWKIPNDYRAVRNMQDTSEPVVSSDSPISAQIEAMVRAACGLCVETPAKKAFSVRRWFGGSPRNLQPPKASPGPQQSTPTIDAAPASAPSEQLPVGRASLHAAKGLYCSALDARRESWNC